MSFIFNPYHKIAGSKALMIGFAFAFITLVIAPFSYAAFDGVLDFHKIHFDNSWVYVALYLISWIVLTITFGFSGMLFSKSKFRWIDIFGTTLLAKSPLLLVAVIAFFIPEIKVEEIQNLNGFPFGISAIIAILMSIFCIIWMVTLLFNAYAISLNIKGNKLIWSFILSLLAAEIFSILILHFLNPFLN